MYDKQWIHDVPTVGSTFEVCTSMIQVAIIAPAMATIRKVYTVTINLQAVEVAEKTAAAMLANNSQLTVSKATNTMNTP